MVCMSCLVSSGPCLGPRRMRSRHGLVEDSCAYGGMCSGEKDHSEQKAFHTHYSYLSGSWKAKKSQVEGVRASGPSKARGMSLRAHVLELSH